MDDGQVEQPADTESLMSALTYKARATFSTANPRTYTHGTHELNPKLLLVIVLNWCFTVHNA